MTRTVRRRLWLFILSVYAVAALGDMTYHLIDDLGTGNRKIEFSELAVAFSAGLFWPLDIVAMALLAIR